MLNQEKAEAELLTKQEDVKEALKQASTTPVQAGPGVATGDKLWFGAYALLLLILGGIYYLLEARAFTLTEAYQSFVQRLVIGAAFVVLLLVLAKSVDIYIIAGIHSTAARYNLRRILKLVAGLLLAIILVSLVRADWYTLLAYFGLVSLVLGLALQTPLSSFFAWIYILARRPYRVGDRIEIGEAHGDHQ